MVTDIRAVPSNAPPLIEVTLSGMVTDIRAVQSLNASAPISVVPAGMSTCPLESGVIRQPALALAKNKNSSSRVLYIVVDFKMFIYFLYY